MITTKNINYYNLNGELKLKGSTIPNNNDKPTAISEYPEKSKYI